MATDFGSGGLGFLSGVGQAAAQQGERTAGLGMRILERDINQKRKRAEEERKKAELQPYYNDILTVTGGVFGPITPEVQAAMDRLSGPDVPLEIKQNLAPIYAMRAKYLAQQKATEPQRMYEEKQRARTEAQWQRQDAAREQFQSVFDAWRADPTPENYDNLMRTAYDAGKQYVFQVEHDPTVEAWKVKHTPLTPLEQAQINEIRARAAYEKSRAAGLSREDTIRKMAIDLLNNGTVETWQKAVEISTSMYDKISGSATQQPPPPPLTLEEAKAQYSKVPPERRVWTLTNIINADDVTDEVKQWATTVLANLMLRPSHTQEAAQIVPPQGQVGAQGESQLGENIQASHIQSSEVGQAKQLALANQQPPPSQSDAQRLQDIMTNPNIPPEVKQWIQQKEWEQRNRAQMTLPPPRRSVPIQPPREQVVPQIQRQQLESIKNDPNMPPQIRQWAAQDLAQ